MTRTQEENQDEHTDWSPGSLSKRREVDRIDWIIGLLAVEGIEFSRGKLSLPVLVVHDATESNLLNMVAFEQIHVQTRGEITSYIAFMNELIDTAEDVR